MQNVLESTILIRFPDCDPFNHLNNSRYLDYFINTRENHLVQHYGFNIYAYAKETGVSWVIGQHQISFLKPALLMEEVVIQTTLIKWNEKDLKVEMRMWNKDKTKLKAFLWTTFVHISLLTQKNELHSASLTERFKQYENTAIDSSSYEKRLAAVIGKTVAEIC